MSRFFPRIITKSLLKEHKSYIYIHDFSWVRWKGGRKVMKSKDFSSTCVNIMSIYLDGCHADISKHQTYQCIYIYIYSIHVLYIYPPTSFPSFPPTPKTKVPRHWCRWNPMCCSPTWRTPWDRRNLRGLLIWNWGGFVGLCPQIYFL